MRQPLFVILAMATTLSARAAVYYVRPDGNDANVGTNDAATGAWRSIDRGQPTWLREPCRPGDTSLQVVKTSHFPGRGRLQLGETLVTYTGRTFQAFTGCEGVPAAKAAALVSCPDRPSPGPGDTVVVKRGVYTVDYPHAPGLLSNVGFGVAMIARGGSAEAPLTIRGEGLPVIDAQSEHKAKCFVVRADHVHIAGFDIRRGGFFSGWTRGGKLLNCRVHEGPYAVSFAYAHDFEIAGNRIYDFQGAWTVHGIVLNRCVGGRIHHNTIVANNCGITVNGCLDCDVGGNLVAWCRRGIAFGAKQASENCRLHDNNIWWAGKGIWLQRDDSNTAEERYVNTTPGPGDISRDPRIIEWTPQRPGFLDYHPDSPCLREGQVLIGAGAATAGYPDAGNPPGVNRVPNPSFEAGFQGWALGAWQGFLPGQAGWEIVEDSAAEGQRCLHLYDFPELKGKGARINVRAISQYMRYTRGRPLTISFRARSEEPGALLGAGFTVPSWQNKSGVGTKVSLTTNWQSYVHTQTMLPRFPDYAALTFTTYRGRYWIDAVQVEEGTNATPFSPALEFVAAWRPGMLIAPGDALQGDVINRTADPVEGTIVGTLRAPLRGEVARVRNTFSVAARARAPVRVTLPPNLTGVFLFEYAFAVDGVETDPARLRFAVGAVPPAGRNHHFFAATPPYATLHAAPLLDRQMNSLAALGLGTLHLYMGYKRMNEILSTDKMDGVLAASRKAGLAWLFTPSDAAALTGKATWAPGPGNVGPEAIEFERPELAKGRCTPAQLDAWDAAVGLLAGRMKDRVRYYEVLNEPNCFLSGDEYTNVLVRTAQAIRAADPAARILAGSVVNATGRDLWNKTMAVPPGTFDAFSYHPYRFGLPNPERQGMGYRGDLVRARRDLAAAGHRVPVWLTEEGMGPGLDETRCIGRRLSYSSGIRKPDWGEGEILQAQYGARMYATALGEGCEGYSYHVLGGLVRDTLMSPNLMLKALHTMDLVLGDAEPLGQIDVGYRYVAYLFRTAPSTPVAAVWAKDAEYAVPIPFRLPGVKEVRALDLFGFPLAVRHAEPARAELSFGRELIYLAFPGMSPDAVCACLHEAFRASHSRPGP